MDRSLSPDTPSVQQGEGGGGASHVALLQPGAGFHIRAVDAEQGRQ